jgi:polysaccharide biosynthesis transport protein
MDAPRVSPFANEYQTERGFQGQSGTLAQNLERFIGLIRRQCLTIIIIAACTMGLGVVYLLKTPPIYTAHARLVIDSGKARMAQMAMPGMYIPVDFAEIATQVEIAKSDSLGLIVVKDQHLSNNPAFVGGARSPDPRSESELTRTALRTLMAQRTITRVGETYVLDIGYTARDPDLAAKMANAIGEAYVDDQLNAKYQSTRRANGWLEDRIKELRAQAAAADLAVYEYKEKNKIIDLRAAGTSTTDSSTRLLGDEQVEQLNAQLILARAATVEAKARLGRIKEIMAQDVPDAGTVDTLNSGVISRLQNQYLDLAQRERIFAQRYGATHLAVVNLRTQMAEIRRSIADELNRIAESIKSDYEIAKGRVQTLDANLNSLISDTQLTNRDRIGLRDLESTARIYHSIYDNFLNRYMEAAQQQSFPFTESRVISAAEPPTYQSAPNTHNVLLTAAFLGLMLGFATGLLREAIDRVFRTRHQVEAILRTNCLAVLPRLMKSAAVAEDVIDGVQNGHEQATPEKKFITDVDGLFSRVVEEPRSLFAEGVRSIKVAADIANAIKENKVMGVTSSVPKEGKSTIASNLAQLMAHAGKRVILVDGDLRNLTLSRALGRGATTGLLEVLANQVDLKEALCNDPRSGLVFLPAVIESSLAHTDEIIASKAFKRLLEELRQNYDYIILDLPPLAPVSDARATAGMIDSYLFVIEWGQTKINVVEHQLASAPEITDRLLGVILSKANVKILNRYEQYYGRNYYNSSDAPYGYS